MTNNDADGFDELSFSLAEGFHAGVEDMPRQTGAQWPTLRDDSCEPPTDVVVLTDALLASASEPAAPAETPLRTPALPAPSLPMAEPLFREPARGPTTKEAFEAIRPNRWVAVALAAMIGVALFGGLLLRHTSSKAPVERQDALTPPPLVEVPVEPVFAPFPAPVATPEPERAGSSAAAAVELPVVTPVVRQAGRVRTRALGSNRTHPSQPAPQADALDAWQ